MDNKILIALASISLAFGLTIGSCIHTKNECIEMEESIKAQYDENKNSLSKHIVSIQEMAQVPDMYKSDLESLYTKTLSARYGSEGTKATFAFIQEHNPNFDSSMYQKLQVTIDSNRSSFSTNQKLLVDKKRAYEVYYQSWPASMWTGILGFPRINLDKYNLVLDEKTENAFQTGRTAPVKLRESK